MNIRTQIFVVLVVLASMFGLVNLIQRKKVDLKYSLLWFLLGFVILVFTCFPELSAKLAAFLGIGLPINLLFFAGFCFALVIIFSLSVSLSNLTEKNKTLTQELGLLRNQVDALLEKTDKIDNEPTI